MSKIIYSIDDCGHPLCVKINDKILQRAKLIQNEILKPLLQDDEYVRCSKSLPKKSELFNISSHIIDGAGPYLEINKNSIGIYLSGYESSERLLEYDVDLLSIPDIYFNDMFIYKSIKGNGLSKEFKLAFKKMPKTHMKILNKLCKKQEEIDIKCRTNSK